ncbi:MAG: helix-turn-helix transcriptional regulator [Streptosporangiaceae bacterium]
MATRPRHPAAEPDEWLTVDEICTELKISRRTFDRWRATGKAPRCQPLPGGTLRIRRSWLEEWLAPPDEKETA